MSPLRSKLSPTTDRGWSSPTTRSVVDKQASAMLDLVRSCGLVFTATITRMLSTMMKGQVRAFTTILAMKAARTSGEIERFRSWKQKVEIEKVVLIVVWFIFARFWLVRAFSLCHGCWDGFVAFCTLLASFLNDSYKSGIAFNCIISICLHFNGLICIISLAHLYITTFMCFVIFNLQYT